MQLILASFTDMEPERLQDLPDRIHDRMGIRKTVSVISDTRTEKLSKRIEELAREVEELQTSMRNKPAYIHRDRYCRHRSRSRSHTRKRQSLQPTGTRGNDSAMPGKGKPSFSSIPDQTCAFMRE